MKAAPTPKNPETTPPMTPTIVTQPQARLGPLSPLAPPPPRPISDGPGSGSEKDSEGEPQDMRVEAGRQTGCRIGRNQSRPGDSRGHAQIDAEASLILRKCPEDIGHYHYQGGALRRLLIHAIEKPEDGCAPSASSEDKANDR